jgi:hypothetical protein
MFNWEPFLSARKVITRNMEIIDHVIITEPDKQCY